MDDSSPTSAELDLPEPEFTPESWKPQTLSKESEERLLAIHREIYRYNRPLAELQRASRVADGQCADRIRALELVIQDLQTAVVDQMEFTDQIEAEIASLKKELPVLVFCAPGEDFFARTPDWRSE